MTANGAYIMPANWAYTYYALLTTFIMKANMNADQTAPVKYKLPNCRTMHVLTGMKNVLSTPHNEDYN